MEPVVRFLDDTLILFMGFTIPGFWLWKEKIAAGQILLAGIWAWLISHLIKYLFYTPRPYTVLKIQPLVHYPPTSGAFPSAHAATAFAIATMVFFYHKKLGLLSYLIASIISILRIWGRVHYPIDVLSGALLGIFVSLTIKRLNVNLGSLNDKKEDRKL